MIVSESHAQQLRETKDKEALKECKFHPNLLTKHFTKQTH